MANRLIFMRLEGHLTQPYVQKQFAEIEPQLQQDEKSVILVNITKASGFDSEAREWFGADWGPSWGKKIAALAVVTDRWLFRIVASTLGLRVGMRIDAFGDERDALRWLDKYR